MKPTALQFPGQSEGHILPNPQAGQIMVIEAPKAAREAMLTLSARLAIRGGLRVLDMGNTFNGYTVAREIRRVLANPIPALERIIVVRAFTCYQVHRLLADTVALPPAEPLLVLDLLNTFNDENVYIGDRRRLLVQGLAFIKQISRRVPVVISVRTPGAEQPESAQFVELVKKAAYQVMVSEPVVEPEQLRMF